MNKSSTQSTSSTSSTSATDQDPKIVEQAKTAVTHVASNVAHQAMDQVNTQFDTRKDKAVETIGNVASAIRETSDKLKGVGPLGDVAGRAADGIEQVADFFEGKQIGDVVKDVERFARREPALFIGAAFALGLIGGRFLKSSAHRSSGVGGGGQYAQSGAGGYDRYESAYGSSFGDDDYLSDSDLQDDIDSQRFGAYGSQRVGRTTQPFGSRGGMQSSQSSQGSSGGGMGGSGGMGMSGSGSMSGGSTSGNPSRGTQASQGSSFGATQGSPQGSSFGASTGSGSAAGSTGTSTATAKTASTPPTPGTSSTSSTSSTSGSSTPKNGLGGGNMGSV